MKPHLQRFQHRGIENGFNEIPWLGDFNKVNDSDPYLETVGVVGSHLTKFRAKSHDAADKNAWGSIDQQPCRVIKLENLHRQASSKAQKILLRENIPKDGLLGEILGDNN